MIGPGTAAVLGAGVVDGVARPPACAEDGLPNSPHRNGSIVSITSGSIGVVALQSR